MPVELAPEECLPTLLRSRPCRESLFSPIKKAASASFDLPAADARGEEKAEEAEEPLQRRSATEPSAGGAQQPVAFGVKNTFIHCGAAQRSPSLEVFYRERVVSTCPSKRAGRVVDVLQDLAGGAEASTIASPLPSPVPFVVRTPARDSPLPRTCLSLASALQAPPQLHSQLQPQPPVLAAAAAAGDQPCAMAAGYAGFGYPQPTSLFQSPPYYCGEFEACPPASCYPHFAAHLAPLPFSAAAPAPSAPPIAPPPTAAPAVGHLLGEAGDACQPPRYQAPSFDAATGHLVCGAAGAAAPLAGAGAALSAAAVPPPPPPLGPAPGSLELPSVGSAGHAGGDCKPCAFMYTKGCNNGLACPFCHLCGPTEKKRRQREKFESKRAAHKAMMTGVAFGIV